MIYLPAWNAHAQPLRSPISPDAKPLSAANPGFNQPCKTTDDVYAELAATAARMSERAKPLPGIPLAEALARDLDSELAEFMLDHPPEVLGVDHAKGPDTMAIAKIQDGKVEAVAVTESEWQEFRQSMLARTRCWP